MTLQDDELTSVKDSIAVNKIPDNNEQFFFIIFLEVFSKNLSRTPSLQLFWE